MLTLLSLAIVEYLTSMKLQFFEELHRACVAALCNPFGSEEGAIVSAKFDKQVDALVQAGEQHVLA